MTTVLEATEATTGTTVEVVEVDHHVGTHQVLHGVSLALHSGELVALAGGSGAGKTTLLQVLAGLRQPTGGTVRRHGAPGVGYVPQDDIIHRELTLGRTLRYAAALRLPAGTSPDEIDRAVAGVLRDLDLADRVDVTVGALSGGQRKRASTAVELLAGPRLLFLDEPTSGLDPATAAEVLAALRRLADRGVTVVLTTHDTADIEACDRVVFLARGGHVAFDGTPAEARAGFGVTDLREVYARLVPRAWTTTPQPVTEATALAPTTRPIGAVRQWSLLTRRAAEVMTRNPLTLAVLIGSPLLVTSMMAVLFPAGALAAPDPCPAQTVFWISFAGFFFGLTYGLLQIVGELPVFRREQFAGVGVGPYVLSKATVLAPLLAVVSAGLLGLLRVLDRLPSEGSGTYLELFVTMFLASLAALGLGLLASATVSDAAQATLALPMLCFPQVLFAGAVVPIGQLSPVGEGISVLMANRWAFEALGRTLDIDSPSYGAAFRGSPVSAWLLLAGFAVALTAATVIVLDRRVRTGSRTPARAAAGPRPGR